jgi:predicted nuclease of predicted toxin-antitoxin system
MFFLIDENLPISLGEVFIKRGYAVECVRNEKQLHGQPDEVLFNYAAAKDGIIVTKDLGFTNPLRFVLSKLKGIIIIRFPNDVSIKTLKTEVARLMEEFKDTDFQQLIVVEPGSVRVRKM